MKEELEVKLGSGFSDTAYRRPRNEESMNTEKKNKILWCQVWLISIVLAGIYIEHVALLCVHNVKD